MKVLVFGPSGSGKTYVAKSLQRLGINAFDDADIEGLSNWYDKNGRRITAPINAEEALKNGYSFLWSKKFLAAFLARYDEVFVFGGSGNITGVFHMFDKVYFLKIDADVQRQRLLSPDRPTPNLDTNNGEFVIWGDWFEQLAIEQNIPFVDARQSPLEIYHIISQKAN